ncbi:hypothetical protein [Providencia sp. PROV019]|uniref:hypothetical protein n=1 Tax=Providencia sp. PROV019 TaxID=2949754 RepID=UPI00234A1ECC|nr:hypothetical protein [Providencia sp. PROV019]
MSGIKSTVIGMIVMLLGVFSLSNIVPILTLGSLILVSVIMINGRDYKVANYYVKGVYLLSITSLFILIFLFDSLFLNKVDKLSFYYQFLVFSFIFSLMINFFSILIIKVMKGKIKSGSFNVVELNNESLNQCPININPASGLPMKNSIDSVGNVIGQNSNSFTDRG